LNIIGADTAEAVKGALARGVRYRTILDSYSDVNLIRQMSALLDDENFEVRSVKMPLKINVAIFDSKEASLNFYPKALAIPLCYGQIIPVFLSHFRPSLRMNGPVQSGFIDLPK
jgi:hypothetical protein